MHSTHLERYDNGLGGILKQPAAGVAMAQIKVVDDRLPISEVGEWTEEKHRLIGYYAGMFATAMKRKWGCRVYIDLFAGSGYSRLKETGRLIPGSPLYSLDISDRFDRYIFCDSDEGNINALEFRIQQRYKNANIFCLNIDVNESTSKIIEKIPMHSKGFKVLSFCLVDPYKLDDVSFNTIRCLSQRFMDFLVLIPTYMDANRNVSHYVKPTNKVIDKFLDDDGWRVEWHPGKGSFGSFILEQFSEKMKALRYNYGGGESAELIRRTENNMPLYHLAFFSRHPLGGKFWKQAKKAVDPQLHLFE